MIPSFFLLGKMNDYVKCLECGTEKSREDTFLDIPLPVRPFGSNIAYNSVVIYFFAMIYNITTSLTFQNNKVIFEILKQQLTNVYRKKR